MTQVGFITDSLCAAKPDPVGDRQTKDVPVTTEGNMESLAQTSDIDKDGSQIPCRAAQSNSCTHTQTNTHMYAHMDRFAKAGTVRRCI